MNSHTCRRFACLLLLTGILSLVLTVSAGAVVYSFGQHPDKERLVLDFDGPAPTYSVSRTGKRQLTVSVPAGALGASGRVPDLGGSQFLSGLRRNGGTINVALKTDAIGYVAFALNDQGKVVLDVFADPLGARWRPRGGVAPVPAAEPAAPPRTAPDRTADQPAPELPPVAEPEAPAPERAAPVPAESDSPAELELPDTESAEATVTEAEMLPEDRSAPTPPPMREEQEQPGTSSEMAQAKPKRSAIKLPYVFRGRVLRPGEEAPDDGFEVAQVQEAPAEAPQADASVSPPASEGPGAPAPKRQVAQGTRPVPSNEGPASSVRRSIAPSGNKPQEAPAAPRMREDQPMDESPSVKPSTPVPASEQEPLDGAPDQREIVKRLVKNLLEDNQKSKFRGTVPKPGEAVSDVRRRLDAAGKGPLAGEPEIQPTNEVLPQPDAVPADVPEAPAAQDAAMADAGATPDEAANATAEEAAKAAKAKREEYMQDIMFAAQSAQSTGDHDTALAELATLLSLPDVPKEMREEAMYTRADVIYSQHKDDLQGHFDEINGAYESAINFNLDSWRVPAALLRRGVINLKVGNIPEAEAYFHLLRDKFEGDPNVPLSYYYWGDHFYRNEDYQKAADEFQYMVQVYPDSKFVREASIGLARSLRKLGYDKQAFQIVDYIEKRWPRFYVEFPPFLRLLGDAAYSVEDYEKAKSDYWTYYNIDPEGEEADIILAKLGDIYVRTDQELAARELYDKALAEFPDREGGLIAKMRLAEEGIYDEPTVAQMFTIFDRPYNLKPAQIYQEIVSDHPDSPLAPLAQLKTAMWHLWNNKYVDAMDAVKEFENLFPESNLLDRARSVGVQAFSRIVDQLITDENYPKIVNLWEKHEFVREKAREMDPSAKLALALSFWKRGLPGTALELVMPFMQEEQIPEYSEMAMSLALSVFVENQAWERVLEVASAVDQWVIADQYQRELAYAKALALENLGRYDESRPLWAELGGDRQLSDDQRAYAIFFMARDALAQKQFRKAYELAQDAYEILVRKNEDKAKIRECLSILMDVTERSGRHREAIKWAKLYRKQLPEGDPSLPGLDYRIAGLYRKGGDYGRWRSMLKKLVEESGDTLYGRLSKSDLEMESINRASQEYVPESQF